MTRIGVELGAAEYEFGIITALQFVGTDRIAVADGLAKNVRLFALDGRHLFTMGKAGGGPGEFTHPGIITADSLIRVFDPVQHRMVIFDAGSGLHISTTRLPVVAGANVTTVIPLRADRFLGITSPAWSWGQPSHQTDVAVLHLPRQGRPDTLATFHQGLTVWYTPGAHAPWGIVAGRFGAAGAWALRDTTLALVDGYGGFVRFFAVRSDGDLVQQSKVPLPGESRVLSPADLVEVEDSARVDNQRSRGRPGRLGLEPPPRWSIGQEALFADGQRLWVLQELTSDLRERWTEVTAQGVGRSWTFPAHARIKAVALPYAAGVERTDDGAQRIVIYTVR